MKIQSYRHQDLAAIGMALALAIMPAISQAQTNAPEKDATKPAQTPNASNTSCDIDIHDRTLWWPAAQWTNGAVGTTPTLTHVIDMLREQHPEADFVISPNLGVIFISDLKLHSVTLDQELQAIQVASGSMFNWIVNNSGIGRGFGRFPPGQQDAQWHQLYTFTELRSRSGLPPNLQVEAFNLVTYLNKDSFRNENEKIKMVEDLKVLVERTWSDYLDMSHQSNNEPKRLSISFHPGANLLIVIGPPEGVLVASKVIDALMGVKHTEQTDSSSSQAMPNTPQSSQRKPPPSSSGDTNP